MTYYFFWQSLLTNEDRMKYNKIGMSKMDTPIRNSLILAFIMLINYNIFFWNFLHDVFFFEWEFIFCLRQNSAFSTFFKGESADLLWREISKCTFWKLMIKNRYTWMRYTYYTKGPDHVQMTKVRMKVFGKILHIFAENLLGARQRM